MKKFEGILICTDLDGTLLLSDKSVSRENLDAIEYFKSEGGLFTFITGRMYFTAASVYNTVKPNAPIGCINGGGIYDFRTGEYVWTRGLSREALELVRFIDKKIPEVGYQINTFKNIYFGKENEAMAEFRRATGYPNQVRNIDEIDEPISKILFGDLCDDNIIRVSETLKEHPLYEKFDYIRSEKTLYEILPKGSSKGSVLPRLCEHLGIDISRAIAVGDYDNDVSMLRTAGIGIAVANATESARAAADYITVSNEEHAIARIIRDIESGNLRV